MCHDLKIGGTETRRVQRQTWRQVFGCWPKESSEGRCGAGIDVRDEGVNCTKLVVRTKGSGKLKRGDGWYAERSDRDREHGWAPGIWVSPRNDRLVWRYRLDGQFGWVGSKERPSVWVLEKTRSPRPSIYSTRAGVRATITGKCPTDQSSGPTTCGVCPIKKNLHFVIIVYDGQSE